MSLVCLIGRHGSGKSTIGAALGAYGFQHTSVGVLRRLAKASQFPCDVPASLMMAIRRERPGVPLTESTARKLVEHVSRTPNSVLDGFPSSIEHIELLPVDTIFCVVWTPALVRELRLRHRSETTKRQWTPGLHSERELVLPILLNTLRRSRRCIFVTNRFTCEVAIRSLMGKLDKVSS